MNATAFAPQDIAGPSALTGRKLPSATPQDADAEEDFVATLAQIADASPTVGTVQQPASASGESPKTDAAIWDAAIRKELSAFSGAADSVADARADPVLGQTDAGAAAKPLARPDTTGSILPLQTAPEATSLPRLSALTGVAALDIPATRGKISTKADDAAKSSDRIQPKTADAASSSKSPAAPKTETPAPAPAASCASNTPSVPLASPLATTAAEALLVPAPAAPSSQPAGAVDDDKGAMQDAVARIGAALAGIAAAPAVQVSPDANEKTERDPSLGEGAMVSVHVVAQKTWLPPVSPTPSIDPRRLSSPDAAAPQAPRATAEKFAETETKAALAGEARDTPVTAPPADARPGGLSGLATATPASSHAPLVEDGAKPADASAATAAHPSVPSASAPAPRRDLEITMAPKDLGGLEVRMKSAGDRLELAFVTERDETARMIADRSGALASHLHGAGLGLGGVEISSAASSGQGGGDAASSSGSGSDQPPQSRTPSGRNRQERSDGAHDQTSDPRDRGDRGLFL